MMLSIDMYVIEHICPFYMLKYNKTCVKRPLKNGQNIDLNDKGSLMKVKSIADCSKEHSA